MSPRRTRAILPAAALALTLGLAACGSDDGADDDATAPAGTGTSSTADAGSADGEVDAAAELLASLETTDVDVTSGDADFPAAVGEAEAPVTMVVFSDYFCGYCHMLATDVLPGIQDLVDDGTLRIEFRDLMWLSEQSGELARAAWAAGLQGEFQAMHASFMSEPFATVDEVTEEALTQRAADLGLDTEQFLADLTSPETAAAVEGNRTLADEVDLGGTPTSVVGGYVVVGVRPAEDLRVIVEAARTAD